MVKKITIIYTYAWTQMTSSFERLTLPSPKCLALSSSRYSHWVASQMWILELVCEHETRRIAAQQAAPTVANSSNIQGLNVVSLRPYIYIYTVYKYTVYIPWYSDLPISPVYPNHDMYIIVLVLLLLLLSLLLLYNVCVCVCYIPYITYSIHSHIFH